MMSKYLQCKKKEYKGRWTSIVTVHPSSPRFEPEPGGEQKGEESKVMGGGEGGENKESHSSKPII